MENRLLAIDGIRKPRTVVATIWKASVEVVLTRKLATKAGTPPAKIEAIEITLLRASIPAQMPVVVVVKRKAPPIFLSERSRE